MVYSLDDTIGMISFDKPKCEIVLSNLLMNALKFTFSDTRVTVSTLVIEDAVRITVKDQGIGLNNVDIRKLFTLSLIHIYKSGLFKLFPVTR